MDESAEPTGGEWQIQLAPRKRVAANEPIHVFRELRRSANSLSKADLTAYELELFDPTGIVP